MNKLKKAKLKKILLEGAIVQYLKIDDDAIKNLHILSQILKEAEKEVVNEQA